MEIAGIIEGRMTLDHKTERTANSAHTTDNGVKAVSAPRLSDRHVVCNLTNTVRRKKSCQENIRGRPIELLYFDASNRSNFKEAPFLSSRIRANTLGESK